MIPKIIFQIWIGDKPLPLEFQKARQSIFEVLPDWKYIEINNSNHEEFVKQYFPDFLKYYISFPYLIQRVDAIRYMFLYIYGGIYIDMDYIVLKSFNEIIKHMDESEKTIGLMKSNNTNILTNSFIISRPKEEFWLHCIENMKTPLKFWVIGKHMKVLKSTGPYMLSETYDRFENKEHIIIFNQLSVPCNICHLKKKQCQHSQEYFILPIEGNSWHSWDSTLLNWIYCSIYHILFFICIFIIIIALFRIFLINSTH